MKGLAPSQMLLHSDTYRVRTALVEQLTRSFYDILWNEYHPLRTRLQLHTLHGPHAERAVLRVSSGHWCAAEQGLAPALPALTRSGSAFVLSDSAVAIRRDEIARFFAAHVECAPFPIPTFPDPSLHLLPLSPPSPHRRAPRPSTWQHPPVHVAAPARPRGRPPVDGAEMRKRMDVLGAGWARLTEKALSGMLRTYTVLIK